MSLTFYKFHAVGNDFLIVESDQLKAIKDIGSLARRMCHRHVGVGADGLMIVGPAGDQQAADFEMRLFNADGSEAEISGNGLRCLAAYLYLAHDWSSPELRIRTKVGVKKHRLLGRQGTRFQFQADIGTPELGSENVPMALEPSLPKVVNYPLEVGKRRVPITACSLGNPHCVLFCDDFSDTDIHELGPQVERHPLFPERTNVEFVRVVGRDQVELRIWERGVGVTLSSGTGSSAAVVASVLNGLTDRQVRVVTPLGELLVVWQDDGVISVAGQTEAVFKGEWFVSEIEHVN
jgi:diaminopimelate epimerase